MARQRTTIDTLELHVKYPGNNGYEHELTEYHREDMRDRLREYRGNCPQHPTKVVRSRVKIPDLKPGEYAGILKAVEAARTRYFARLKAKRAAK